MRTAAKGNESGRQVPCVNASRRGCLLGRRVEGHDVHWRQAVGAGQPCLVVGTDKQDPARPLAAAVLEGVVLHALVFAEGARGGARHRRRLREAVAARRGQLPVLARA